MTDDELRRLLQTRGDLEGLAREIGQGDTTACQQEPPCNDKATQRSDAKALRMIRWLLRQDAVSVLFVVIAAALTAWFVWTLL